MKILLIEDDVYFPNMFIEMITSIGHEVIHFDDGLEGFKHYKENRMYDVIVCDYQLPSMLGDDIVKEIKKFSKVPIVACSSAYNFEMMLAGANAFIDEKRIYPDNCKDYPSVSDWELTLKGVL
jgi:CheY-like chemotaxis protein